MVTKRSMHFHSSTPIETDQQRYTEKSQTNACLIEQVDWGELYQAVLPLARFLAHTRGDQCWNGQEEDMAHDIAQETIKRIFERMVKAKRGEAEPVQSPRQMMSVVAYNYVRDLLRHDQRIQHVNNDEVILQTRSQTHNICEILDYVCEKIDQMELFTDIAQAVLDFPPKRRKVLLIDLANRMAFDVQLTPLQAAFAAVGIDMQDYQCPLPINNRERNSHNSLLCQAYKHLTRHPKIKLYLKKQR